MNLFLIILVVSTSVPFILDVIISVLNRFQSKRDIPKNVEDIYDEAQYNKWIRYRADKNNYKLLSKSLPLILRLAILLFGGYQVIESYSLSLSNNIYIINILILTIYGTVFYIISVAFEYIDTFRVEEKHGFNKTSHKRFLKDQVIEFFITGLLGIGILVLFTFISSKVDNVFYIYMFGILIVIVALINIFFVSLIMPLLYKMSPLPDGPLRVKITELSIQSGYKISQIVIIDASARTTKLNAYFSGFGKTKKVMIFDTVLETLTDDEICAVIAHEVGHANFNHMFKDMAKTIFNIGLYTFLFYLLATSKTIANNLDITEYFSFVVIVFLLLASPLNMLSSIFSNYISRHHEYQADAICVKYNLGEAMINAFKKVGRLNLADLTPHPLFVFMKYSHPPLSKRIAALTREIEEKK